MLRQAAPPPGSSTGELGPDSRSWHPGRQCRSTSLNRLDSSRRKLTKAHTTRGRQDQAQEGQVDDREAGGAQHRLITMTPIKAAGVAPSVRTTGTGVLRWQPW